MNDPHGTLTLQFLDWVARRPRTYAEAMEAWRSTCPRMTVWEDALLAGLVRVERAGAARGARVALTSLGREALCAWRESTTALGAGTVVPARRP